MKILIGCEFSGIVRQAFRVKGHEAYSCDVLPAEDGGPHFQEDVLTVLDKGWDLAIFHPPCTHLAVSGARWFKDKHEEQEQAVLFVNKLLNAPIERIALENPVGVLSTRIRKPDQIIQPYHFGEPYRKTTCLWLKNLPLLTPTNMVEEGAIHTTKSGKKLPKWYNLPPSDDRWKIRSRTFQGIADAMAEQRGTF
ncbi:MAG: DNA cytosine methyltransferase [Nitrososphaera sp.]